MWRASDPPCPADEWLVLHQSNSVIRSVLGRELRWCPRYRKSSPHREQKIKTKATASEHHRGQLLGVKVSMPLTKIKATRSQTSVHKWARMKHKGKTVTNFCLTELSFFFFKYTVKEAIYLPLGIQMRPWYRGLGETAPSLPAPFGASCFSLCQKLSGLISLKCKIKTWVSKQRFPSLFSKHFTLTKHSLHGGKKP